MTDQYQERVRVSAIALGKRLRQVRDETRGDEAMTQLGRLGRRKCVSCQEWFAFDEVEGTMVGPVCRQCALPRLPEPELEPIDQRLRAAGAQTLPGLE